MEPTDGVRQNGKQTRIADALWQSLTGYHESAGTDNEPTLLHMWQVVRERMWIVLGVFLTVFTFTVFRTVTEKPVYRAKALLEIQKERPDLVSVDEFFQVQGISNPHLQTQYKILKSNTLAQRVIKQLELDQKEEFTRPGGWRRPPRSFEESLSVNPVKDSRLVEVSFESEDPQLAALVVNTLVKNYVDQHLEIRLDNSHKAAGWMEQQLREVEQRLQKASSQLQEYARDNDIFVLQSANNEGSSIADDRLRDLEKEATRAETRRYEREALYRTVKTGRFDPSSAQGMTGAMEQLLTRRGELQSRQTQLLGRFGPEYPAVKQNEKELATVQAMLEREREHAAKQVYEDYQAALEHEQLLRRALEDEKARATSVAQRAVQYSILQREVETSQKLYDSLLQRLKEAGVSAEIKANNVRVVDQAEPPGQPVRPNVPRNLLLGSGTGLVLGVCVVLVLGYLDDTAKAAGQVERALNLPTLAAIPQIGLLSSSRWAILPALWRAQKEHRKGASGGQEDDSIRRLSLVDAFRDLRTSVLLSSAHSAPRSLLVSSAQRKEGKTTIAVNLGISFSQLGLRVLVIDCDLRCPSVHRVLGLPNNEGLVSFLAGQRSWRSAVVQSGIPGLDILPAGPTPPNSTELLAAQEMQVLMDETAAHYQMVVLDSPMMGKLADARTLAPLVEAVVFIVRSGYTPLKLARKASSRISEVGGKLIGVVLNRVDQRKEESYYDYRRDDTAVHPDSLLVVPALDREG